MLLSLSFAMPSSPIELYITLWNGAPGQGEAYYRGYVGPYPVVITLGQWMDVQKPQWLRDSLDGKWLDDLWGGKGSYVFAPLKPLFWTIGWLMEKAVDFLLNVFNNFVNTMKGLWDNQWSQNIGLAGMIRSLGEGMVGLRNLFEEIGGSFEGLLTRILREIVKAEPFKTLVDMFNLLAEFTPDNWAELKNLITNPVDYFFDRLDEWLNEEVPP